MSSESEVNQSGTSVGQRRAGKQILCRYEHAALCTALMGKTHTLIRRRAHQGRSRPLNKAAGLQAAGTALGRSLKKFLNLSRIIKVVSQASQEHYSSRRGMKNTLNACAAVEAE